MQSTRIKICCIRNVDEAKLAVQSGASALGLVSKMPSGPGPIPDDKIAEIAITIPSNIDSVLLTSRQDVSSIVAQLRRCQVSTVQLCDDLAQGSFDQLRTEVPGIHIIQVIHVTGEVAIHEARRVERSVDAILLDSGNPAEPLKRLGGTGRVHDWSISRKIRDLVAVPVHLAGGLRPDNVTRAIGQVLPYAVDVCSGVRTDDILDERKLHAFVEATAMADRGWP